MGGKVLIVGLGEVGSAIYQIVKDAGVYELYGYDIDQKKTVNSLSEIPEELDFIHVCVPFKNVDTFARIIHFYVDRFRPRAIIIHSTVAPGTTKRIYEETKITTAFTPVRGKHPYLKQHILFWPKWVCVLPREEEDYVVGHLKSLNLKVKVYRGNPETLELAKIFETVYRALLIAWWQEMHRITKHFNADMATITEFIGEIHEQLKDKPPMFPGFIGGHCLIPNTLMLYNVYKSKFLEAILESNARRLEAVSYTHLTLPTTERV